MVGKGREGVFWERRGVEEKGKRGGTKRSDDLGKRESECHNMNR